MYLGDFNPGDVVDFKFTTFDSTGAPITLAGSPAVSVYQTNSTTESTAGVTLTTDFDSRTGMHHVRITTVTDGSFYAAARDFQVVLTAGTVNSVSVVGYILREFSIQNRNFLRPTTAGRTLDVSAGGEAGLDWANIGSPTTSNALSGTSILLTAGTGTGQLDFTSGVVKANATQFAGQTITCSGGVTVPAATLASTTNITAGTITTVTNLTTNNDKTGYSLSGTQTFNVTGNITGNLSGSVGSVTGAVGSVTSGVTVTTNSDKTGYSLASTGLNLVLIDTVAMPTAIGYMAAATAGKSAVSGSTVTFTGIDGSTLHITATTDSNGQRTAVSYS